MNFYSFHPGDYTLRTAHLEPLEDLAYRRLLDLYYLNEKPLAGTPDELARIIRMRTSAVEVKAVLEEFFNLADAGWIHGHCDEVIAKYHAKAKQAATNGKAGGRPKKPSDNPEETQPVNAGLPEESESKTNQKPETNNHNQIDQELPAAVASAALVGVPVEPSPKTKRKSAIPETFLLTTEMAKWARERAPAANLPLETEKFVNHYRGKGEVRADWVASWRTWMLNAQTYAQRPSRGGAAAEPDFDDLSWTKDLGVL